MPEPDYVYVPVSLSLVADPDFWSWVLPVLQEHVRQWHPAAVLTPQMCRIVEYHPETGEWGGSANRAYVVYRLPNASHINPTYPSPGKDPILDWMRAQGLPDPGTPESENWP